jgi:hypothetical protein
MKIFKKIFSSKIDRLKSQIKEKNLLLLDEEESQSLYYVQKLYDWQEEFDDEDFLEKFLTI